LAPEDRAVGEAVLRAAPARTGRILRARRLEAVNGVVIGRISADLAQAANPVRAVQGRISLADPARAVVNVVEVSPATLAAAQVGAGAAAPLLLAFSLRSTQIRTAL
jgi:hypothetical protein